MPDPGSSATARRSAPGACAVAIVLLAALTGCSTRAGVPLPATEQGEEVLSLWRALFWAAVVVGGIVLGLIAWCVVRYRRRSGVSRDDLPKQTPGSIPLEVLYTVVPLLLAAILFGLAVRADSRTRELSSSPDLRVDVTGFQWQWRFDYPTEGVTVIGSEGRPPELVLPVGQTVRFRLVAADVIHSFYVPAFLVKHDLIPGRTDEVELRPTRTGLFGGNCAEFCGLNHNLMGFDVRVVSPEQFQAWASTQRGAQEQPEIQAAR